MSLAAIVDHAGDFALQFATAYDAVDESMLKQEFAGLKAFRKLDADRGLDRARPGKANQGLGFGEDEIAQRGKTGGNASHRRIGEYGNEQPSAVVVASQSSGDLSHLHQ